ncbi:MAG: ribonuclease H-like domain-containing protein [archaeon]
MTQYYFDTETEGFDPKELKLLTVQFQELDYKGKPRGKLTILKEWEMREEMLVKEVHKILLDKNVWNFIPILTNHIFDFTFLFAKFKKYNLPCPNLSDWLYTKPFIDIKYSLIMANNLNFKGSGLDQITNKETDGRKVPIWYKNKEYIKIEEYITQEKESFLEFFCDAVDSLKQVRYKIEDKGGEDDAGDPYYKR